MIRLVPAYTLEMLDECDIERLLPFYFANTQLLTEPTNLNEENIVIRDGKKYRKVTGKAEWVKNIF